MRIVAHGHIRGDNGGLRFTFGVDPEIGNVAGMGTFGVLQAVVLAGGIEMASGRLEVWALALGRLMDMNGMFAGCKIVEIELDFHALGVGREGSIANILALAILQRDNFGLD